jgi:hypothetical protein
MDEKMKYWCDDCKVFVKENHRCQQWETVYRVPSEAIKSALSESKKEIDRLNQAIEEIGSILYYDTDGMGDAKEALKIINRIETWESKQ